MRDVMAKHSGLRKGVGMHGEERKLETEALHTQWLKNAVAFVSMLRRNAKCDVGRLMVRVEKEEVSQLAPTLWFDRRQLFFREKPRRTEKAEKGRCGERALIRIT